jgi:hypothetical protein
MASVLLLLGPVTPAPAIRFPPPPRLYWVDFRLVEKNGEHLRVLQRLAIGEPEGQSSSGTLSPVQRDDDYAALLEQVNRCKPAPNLPGLSESSATLTAQTTRLNEKTVRLGICFEATNALPAPKGGARLQSLKVHIDQEVELGKTVEVVLQEGSRYSTLAVQFRVTSCSSLGPEQLP